MQSRIEALRQKVERAEAAASEAVDNMSILTLPDLVWEFHRGLSDALELLEEGDPLPADELKRLKPLRAKVEEAEADARQTHDSGSIITLPDLMYNYARGLSDALELVEESTATSVNVQEPAMPAPIEDWRIG